MVLSASAGGRRDVETPRTPMAWQHRDLNYSHNGYVDKYSVATPRSSTSEHYKMERMQGARGYTGGGSHHNMLRAGGTPRGPRVTSSTSETSSPSDTSTSDDAEPDTDPAYNDRQALVAQPRPGSYYTPVPMMLSPAGPGFDGTLRSTMSVPMLAPPLVPTWDGEPCPVHGLGIPPPPPPFLTRRSASIYDMRPYATLPLPLPAPPTMSLPPPATMGRRPPSQGVAIPPHLLPPMMRPRPLVYPADAFAPPEPLPMRDPEKKSLTPIPPKEEVEERPRKRKCCRGPMLILWIILGVIAFGIVLGIVLNLTVA